MCIKIIALGTGTLLLLTKSDDHHSRRKCSYESFAHCGLDCSLQFSDTMLIQQVQLQCKCRIDNISS